MVARVYTDTVTFSGPLQEEWMDESNCASSDPEAFFSFDKVVQERSKEICMGCDVRIKCLAFALINENKNDQVRYGIWGGLDPAERRKLQKKLTEAAKIQRQLAEEERQ